MIMKLVKTYNKKPVATVTRSFDDGTELFEFLKSASGGEELFSERACIEDVMTRDSVVYTVPVSGPGYSCVTSNDERCAK